MSIGGGRTKFLLDGQIMKHVIVPCTTQLMLKGYCIVQLYGGGNIGKFGELSAIRQCFTYQYFPYPYKCLLSQLRA